MPVDKHSCFVPGILYQAPDAVNLVHQPSVCLNSGDCREDENIGVYDRPNSGPGNLMTE